MLGGDFEKNVEGGVKYCGGKARFKSLQQGVHLKRNIMVAIPGLKVYSKGLHLKN